MKIGLSLSTQPYEPGAVLVSVLAWPDALSDEEAMATRQAAICQMYLRARGDIDPEWMLTEQPIKPAYALLPWSRVDTFEREMKHRLRQRMAAARMAMPFLVEAQGGVLKSEKPIGRLSINKMAERVIRDTGENDPGNIKTRIWRPSRPVIHIAAAVAAAVTHGESAGAEVHVGHLIARPEVIRWVVDRSNEYADLIPKIPRLRIAESELVRLVLT